MLSADPGAGAGGQARLGVYHDWTVYSANAGNGAICFAVAKPIEVTPSPDGYTQGYLYLTHRPADQISNELNLVAGFNMGEDQPVMLSVAGQNYPLFAQADAAWLQDPTKNDGSRRHDARRARDRRDRHDHRQGHQGQRDVFGCRAPLVATKAKIRSAAGA